MDAMKNKSGRFPKALFWAVVFGMAAAVAGHFHFSKSAWVTVSLQSNVATYFRIYWADQGQAYEETRMGFTRINPVQTQYGFSIGDLKSIRKLRIDPSDNNPGRAKVLIQSIRIRQPGYAPIRFDSPEDFTKLQPVSGVRDHRLDQAGLMVRAETIDPQLEVHILPVSVSTPVRESAQIGLSAFLLILLFHWGFQKKGTFFSRVPLLLAFAAALVMSMAVFSKRNVHPDEYVHIAAGTYYETHWLPPPVCAPGTENTYSIYGVSRLNSKEAVYPLAGKFSRLFSFLPLESYLRLRLFNVTLFLLICLICFRYPDSRILGAAFLVSPQIWYVFSYFNSDAFSLFLVFVVGYQVLGEDTLFNRYLTAPWKGQTVFMGVGFGVLFAALLFIKLNFYVFILFLLLMAAWRLFFETTAPEIRWELIGKLALLFFMVALCFSVWRVTDYAVKGPEKAEKIIECREKLAHFMYKPSTPLEKKHPWMMLKTRGVSIEDMFHQFHWGKILFNSAFGLYGYMTIFGPSEYYTAAKHLAFGFCLFLALSLFIEPSRGKSAVFLMVLFCSIFLAGAAFLSAWTSILQAQGRYLLPIAGMIGFFWDKLKNQSLRAGLEAFLVLFFLLSICSFIFVGMMNIPKQWP